MKFTEMGLSEYIVNGLTSQGIETATEIQTLTMPLIKSGADIIGLSQTGSGKTYAYGIPALERINTELPAVQVLVVSPTRELAAQIADDLRKLTNNTSKIGIAPIFGGSNMDRQIAALKRGAKIVIGTPGRLMDHLRRKTLKLDNLKMVILDEADEMLNMGFKEDIEKILKTTPANRQTIMFSATMPPEIIRITKQYMKEPVIIKTKNQDSSHALIKQYFVNCERTQKTEVLGKIYEKFNPWISIVFCNTIRMTEELTKSLVKNGLSAVCLNGDMRQKERQRVMESFKKSDGGGILVATDVAARGIDIKNVDIVVNYDFPNNEDYYVHRIGRTGRAGKEGVALTIINTKQQAKDLQNLTSKTGGRVEEYAILSTVQWSVKESARGESRKRPEAQREQRNRNGRANDRKGFGHERNNFKNSNGKPNRNTFSGKEEHRKKSGFVNDSAERKNKPKTYGNVEVFEIGGGSSRFGKPHANKRALGRFGKNSSRKTLENTTQRIRGNQ